MKILFCNQGFDETVGGPAASVPILAKALKNLGHDVAFLSVNGLLMTQTP